jgi:hypothetical protein
VRGFLARSFSALMAVGSIAAVVLLMVGIFGEVPRSTSADLPHVPTSVKPTSPTSTAPPPTPGLPTITPSTTAPQTSAPQTSAPQTGTASTPTSVAPIAIPELEVIVLNSTDVPGLATRVSNYLGALGWHMGPAANFPSFLDVTTVYYPEGQEAAARQLAAVTPGNAHAVAPVIPEVEPDVLTVVLGADSSEWTGSTTSSPPATSPPPT